MQDAAADQITKSMHTAMAPVGVLKGHDELHQAAGDLDIATYAGHLLHGEVLPSFSEYDESDESQDALIEKADQVTAGFGAEGQKLKGSLLGPDPIADWKTHNLPLVRAAWARGDEAPANVFALAAIAAARGGLPANASEEQLTEWFSNLIKESGFFAQDDGAEAQKFCDKLAAEAAGYAYTIQDEGVKTALKANFQ